MFFLKMYDILGFSNFLYFPQITQHNFFILFIQNIFVLFYHPIHICYEKTNAYNLNKLLPFNIKSINPIQNYVHITESYACILQIFVMIFLFPIIFSTSFGIFSTPLLSKYIL